MKKLDIFLSLLLIVVFSVIVKAQPGANDPNFNPTDIGFGTGGGANTSVVATAIQSDFKVVIGGDFITYNGTTRNRIARLNTNGTLDTTFNPGTGANSSVYTTVIQSDGKIIIGGSFTSYNETVINRIARINVDGTLDPTFSPGTGASNYINSIALQSDGKIIIGGNFISYDGTTVNRIARLNSDGTLDNTFNTGTGVDNVIYTIAIQSDGKIIIGGNFTSCNGTSINRIARLNSDGTLDNTFNPGTGADNVVRTIALQSDGKIIIGGSFISYNGTSINRLARLNSDGMLDATFNSGTGASNEVSKIAIQSDGKVIIGGYFTSYNGTAINYIARLNVDGTLDVTFNIGTGASGSVRTIAIQSDGKIIIGGDFNYYNGIIRIRIARLNSDGVLDTSFFLFTGANNKVSVTAIQSDGKIIIGGSFFSYNGTARNRIARLNIDGTLDTTFNIGTGANNEVRTIAIQSNGRILIGGDFTSYNGTTRNCIARLNTDGTLDGTFNPSSGADASIYSISIQSDGKIIIGGSFTTFNGTTKNRIARLNANGSIDASFNLGTGANNTIYTTAIQSDGKIFIGGSFTSYNGNTRNRIALINTDGILDFTFVPSSGANASVYSISIQSDGKIIIGGAFFSFNGNTHNHIARLNENGTNDFTFNSGTGASSTIYATAIQDDGKIIIGGDFNIYNGTTRNRLARLNVNGSRDATFDPVLGANNNVHSISIQSNGKIIIGGTFTSYYGIGRNRIARVKNLNCDDSFSSITETVCDSYTAPDGQIHNTSGIKTAIISNSTGCDSIITVDLTINYSTTSTIAEMACDSYTAPDGQVYSSSGTYTAVIPNAAGCDSTITINLTIQSTTSSITTTACDSYTAPDGQVYTATGIITAIIPNAAGCDSTITIDLTINTVDVSLTVNDPAITANASGAMYQWVDCNNGYLPISGEINQIFTATANGNYAVFVTQGLCSDTSICTQITSVGMSSEQAKELTLIYPNPATDILNIEFEGEFRNDRMVIFNSLGKEVKNADLQSNKSLIDISDLPQGLYLIKIFKKCEVFAISIIR